MNWISAIALSCQPCAQPPNSALQRAGTHEVLGRRRLGIRKCLLILGTLILASGCTTTRVAEAEPCSADTGFCEVLHFAVATEANLRSHAGWVEVACPSHPLRPPASSVMPECVELVRAALVLANANHKLALLPIELSEVTIRDSVVFVDTFRPGNEAFDEHAVIYAKIPLRWKH